MRRHASALLLLLVLSSLPAAGQKRKPQADLPSIAPLDLAQLLDLYAGGRFDEAVHRVAQASGETGRHLRRHWDVSGRQWIDADPAQRPQRILVAAAFALETEYVRAERGDWRITDDPPCAGACVLDWAQLRLIERGPPDPAERAWFLAAAALAGGVRDWRYLQRPMDPLRPTRLLPGLMDRGLLRFPGDPSLRLEQALAAAGRFNVTVDAGRLAPTLMPLPPSFGSPGVTITSLRLDGREPAELLTALVDDPLVGAEARMRLGYLYWALGRDEASRDALAKAAAQTSDADIRYLAQFLRGWFAIARGDSAGAIPPLEAALAARPGSQSATLALASLELQRGDAGKAHDLARASLDRTTDLDPWRLFLYGHHPQWPARVAELRRAVTR